MTRFPRTRRAAAVAALLALGTASLSAQAADFAFNGSIAFHNDLVLIDFSLASDGQSVSIWTDSWLSGLNFDPQISVWQGGVWQAGNDDADPLLASQGYYDAGLTLTLAAGDYRVVLAAASNDALGGTLAEGFAYDADAPIALADWTQPSSDINAGDQKGGAWTLHLSGVTMAAAVPEPGAAWLLLAGLVGVGALARARKA